MSSLHRALTELLGAADADRASAQIPAAWTGLPAGSVLLTTLVDGASARTVRALRDETWRVSLDDASDLGRDREQVLFAGELSRRLAHDLQAPITAAAGYVELSASESNPDIELSVGLLHDLAALNALRAERAPRSLDEEPAEIGEVLELGEVLAREFRRHRASFSLSAPPVIDAKLCNAALCCALVTLGENALDAIKRGGSSARATIAHHDERVVLQIVDDGAGFDPAHRAAIGRKGWSHRGRRMSLGLWVLRVVAASLDGAIALSPNELRGVDARVCVRARALQ